MEYRLAPISKKDYKTLLSWIKGKDKAFIMQWAGPILDYPVSLHQLIHHYENDIKSGNIEAYKCIDTKTKRMLGYIELYDINSLHRKARISRVIVGENQRKGVGTNMVRELLWKAFEEYQLNRIDLLVFDFNVPAISLYEKVGFMKEGLLREYTKVDDTYWNAYIMSILKKEWNG